MDTMQQISVFIGMTFLLCYGFYKKNLAQSAKKEDIKTTYIKSLKKLKGNPKNQKLRDDVIEKGSAYYISIKKTPERLNQSDFDAIDFDIKEVMKNPKALKNT